MPTEQIPPTSTTSAPSIARGSIEPAIGKHRTADASITVIGRDGSPAPGVDLTVVQRDHAFLFGATAFDLIPYLNGELEGDANAAERARMERFRDRWLALLNFATMPFYWGRFEPERGKPNTARTLKASRWFAERGIAVKGHPLLWHTVCADWLLPLTNDEIVAAQKARIRREVTDFRGVIDTWDVVNEAVIMPVFDKYDNGITRICRANGQIATIRMAFAEARETNPGAFLLLNDFDMSTAFECLIEGVLEAGIRIDAIGLQSHMHQGYWGEEKTLGIVDRFARYGLPIQFTETTIVSGHLMPPEIEDLNDYQIPDWPTTPEGEERQADEVVRHYKTVLSHPAVTAATYWDLADGGWLGAPAGLIRRDGTPKPAYDELLGLVKGDWWVAPAAVRTDAQGRIRIRGFLGEYEVSAAEPGGEAATRFRLDRPGDVELEVRL